MKLRHWTYLTIALLTIGLAAIWASGKINLNPRYEVGQPIDSLNGVQVYHNGGVGNVSGRNIKEGYNIGLQYQCVEFVKRYYYEHLNHKMPNSYGHAKDFFDASVPDGQRNPERGLLQYTNPSQSRPKVNDILIFKGTIFNRYGHVAIVSRVGDGELEVIQQNPGPFGSSRAVYKLEKVGGSWRVGNSRVLGWLGER